MDASTQEIQRLLKAIYQSFSTAARISMDIMSRAHWVDGLTQYHYTAQAKQEFETCYLR